MTGLEEKLRNMAQVDWERFVNLLGADALMAAKITMLRRDGNSYKQISIKLRITERQARYGVKKISDKVCQQSVKS